MIPLVSEMVGRTLAGRYRLLRILGAGGIGHVFEAEQLGLDRRVAVKILRFVDQRGLARFRQEARVAASLRHPNVVSILDFQTNPGEPAFLVMELLEGESLAELGQREAPLAPARAARIAVQLLSGLAAAHDAGLVHRDVKPGNVWIAKTLAGEVVKVLDFGLVRTPDVRLTETGEIVGTPAFLAPEQLRGTAVDARADLHAVGAVLYVMLSGRLPWRGGEMLPVDILGTVPAPLADVVPGVPRGLSDVVAKALAKDPAARWASAAEMVRALEPFAAEAPVASTIAGPSVPRTRPRAPERLPRALVVAMGVTGALAVAVGVLVWARMAERRRGGGGGEADASAHADADVIADAHVIADADVIAEADAGTRADAGGSAAASRSGAVLRFARASDPYVCRCIADVSTGRGVLRTVCPIAPPALCQCKTFDESELLCGAEADGGDCAHAPSRFVASQDKQPCTGQAANGFLGQGRVSCDHCPRGSDVYVGASNGASCRGVFLDGLSFTGTWRCRAR